MSMERHRVTVTVVRPGGRDTWGNESPGSEFDIPRCLLAPTANGGTSSNEFNDQANTVITGAALYLPPGADLQPSDRVRVRGVLYEVEGEVGDWGPAGMQVSLQRSTG